MMDQAEHLRNIIKQNTVRPTTVARIITITSGKGGVGKSNVAVNLAVKFQELGKKVLIFDADFGLANVEVMFGAVPKYNLSDIIYNGKSMSDVITYGANGIGFISAGSGIVSMRNIDNSQLSYLSHSLASLDYLADTILIDTGAGISDSVMEFVMAGTEILLVVTNEPTSLTDSYSLLKAMSLNPKYNKNDCRVKVIANKVTSVEEGELVYKKLESVVKQFLNVNMEFQGIIPYDINLVRAVREQNPVSIYMPNSISSKAFESLAKRLINEEEYMPEKTTRESISSILLRMFKKRSM
ncbi:flagellar biosynthesis protein FlhG [Acetitomaculum ruminis DSM 5522]|uniref:Flagellar biosynthesis protein FlhG n=1 Tax=Acetitomaculum ruminis DSM 5522 TaxID=1120918 RepID=A0A1I0ZM66_9FIRM|nr:MinD/ParA family protein [Acetitomaculum ruminis]SFB25283.1 flagellar biosynthesis protein FlhG [Acetitomaculum ruminis DSM 5522]